MEFHTILLLFFSLNSIFLISTAIDSFSASQSIKDGGETIVSASGLFELEFFSIGNSTDRKYLGIRYKKISNGTTVAWVANRETPLNNSSGVLKFNDKGFLVLLNHNNLTVWSANSSGVAQNPVAQLLDSGNLIIRDESDLNPENYFWQSFHYPDHTFLPGMKIGRLAGGLEVNISSWNSVDNPSRGIFSYQMDSSNLQFGVERNSVVISRSGPWNGVGFSGMPYIRPNPIYNYFYVSDEKETYYSYELANSSVYTRVVLSENGVMDRYAWIDRIGDWQLYASAPADNCDTYALCGPQGSCDISNTPTCSCLNGFVPKLENVWDAADWSDGCVRRTSLDCQKGDGFVRYPNVKLPDLLNSSMNASMTLEECRTVCLKNCSCMAYANTNISGSGSGCFLWFGDLIDIKQYDDGDGQDLYIRMASSELENKASSGSKNRAAIIAISLSITTLLLVLGLRLFIVKRKRKNLIYTQGIRDNNRRVNYSTDNHQEDIELPHYDFSIIANATNFFSFNNMLGEGGFGPVYKGMLEGKAIAVKRLSKDSRQGLNEFKNEVKCIAKLQHRNLVKLLGYCVQHDEKMLIYEYMPNKSLDFYIFDETRSKLLDWSARFSIINGISRGLLYLHRDSRLRIIHRDLKASNILLDNEMNPKISDFGMARIFGSNETEANTKRVVGTYGYMSPEYTIDGLFSLKSDVYSFGVLGLEIISGKRNRGFYHPEHQLNLLGHAWILFKENRSSELIDTLLMESCNLSQVLRSIHVSLLCVQNSPEDRPSMSSVVVMLSGDGALPEPKEPGFFTERQLIDAETDLNNQESCSVNELTITLIDVR